jgi:hypothetical protein
MIIFGNNNIVPHLLLDADRYFVLNFFNPTNLGTRLSNLWAPEIILKTCPLDSVEFDMSYANYILTNDNAFQDFMEILMSMYYNEDVFVLTDLDSPPVVSMCESIIKLIQQRYGFNCYIANDIGDILVIPDSEMTESGNQIFMQDKERYTTISVDTEKLLENIETIGVENDRHI